MSEANNTGEISELVENLLVVLQSKDGNVPVGLSEKLGRLVNTNTYVRHVRACGKFHDGDWDDFLEKQYSPDIAKEYTNGRLRHFENSKARVEALREADAELRKVNPEYSVIKAYKLLCPSDFSEDTQQIKFDGNIPPYHGSPQKKESA